MEQKIEYRIRKLNLLIRCEQSHMDNLKLFKKRLENEKSNDQARIRFERAFRRRSNIIEDNFRKCLQQLRHRYTENWRLSWDFYE